MRRRCGIDRDGGVVCALRCCLSCIWDDCMIGMDAGVVFFLVAWGAEMGCCLFCWRCCARLLILFFGLNTAYDDDDDDELR